MQYITASGGPLLNVPLSKFKNLSKKVLNHPNWKMGKNNCRFCYYDE